MEPNKLNAMGQVDPAYEPTIRNIMKWADADEKPDLEHGWPGADAVTRKDGNQDLDSAQSLAYSFKYLLVNLCGQTL